MILTAILKCPACGFTKEETMPARGVESRYQCVQCGVWMETKTGECCVFCSHSNMICPPEQEKRDCCSG